MEVGRGNGWVIFETEDGRFWANVLEGIVSDPLDTIEEARAWVRDMLPPAYNRDENH
jgi:hypothetical protein